MIYLVGDCEPAQRWLSKFAPSNPEAIVQRVLDSFESHLYEPESGDRIVLVSQSRRARDGFDDLCRCRSVADQRRTLPA